jgi:hypothetical protein
VIGSARHDVLNHIAMLQKTLDSRSAKMAPQESKEKTDAVPVLEVAERGVNPAILPAERAQFHHLPMTRALLSFVLYKAVVRFKQ